MTTRNASPRCPDGQSEAQTTVGFQAPARQCAEGMMTAGPCPGPRPRAGGCVSWLAALAPGTPREPCWALREAPGPGRWALRDATHCSVQTWLLVPTPPAPHYLRLLNRLLQSRVRGPRAPHIGS